MLCPYCKQEHVWEVEVKTLDSPAFICAECDTIWLNRDDIVDGKGKDFEDFMAERGMEANWKKYVSKIRRTEAARRNSP